MVKLTLLCSLPQFHQPSQFHQGDWVRYIGVDPKLQQDYSNQDLQIVAIDLKHKIAICDNKMGQRLVGVALCDLQRTT